jgi:hypothetical protein
MGRGLGERQRQILDHLGRDPGAWVPLWHLADDPDDPNEMAKARSAVRGLEGHGLVNTARMSDPDRRVDTTVVFAEVGSDGRVHYYGEPASREWSGMHVRMARKLGPLTAPPSSLRLRNPAPRSPERSNGPDPYPR